MRFAEHGVDAIAIDYFGRTAGIGDRGPDFDYRPHVAADRRTTGLRADVRAAAAPPAQRRAASIASSPPASAWAAG